jgi:hypothetical protein
LPSSTIQTVSESLRAPYLIQSAFSVERQLPFNTTVALTYANSHGVHMLRSRDINAPVPGTYDPDIPGSGVYPLGRRGLVVLMESSGLYNQNQFLVNVNSRVNSNVSLTGLYAYGRAMSNTDGLGTFPANPYSMEGEYGPAAIDMRHRVSLSGTISMKWGIRLNPLLTANTGPPFDITTGRDLYGDTIFNDRPAIATDPTKTGLIETPYGLLDPNPAPGQKMLPRNFGRGPGQIMANLRVARTFTSAHEKDTHRSRRIREECRADRAAADRIAVSRRARSRWAGQAGAAERQAGVTVWWFPCRFGTSRITTIPVRSSATSHRRCLDRRTSRPVPVMPYSRRTPIIGAWNCK